MLPELETFLGGLFARCVPTAYLTLSAIFPGGARPTPSRHVPLADHAALVEAVDRLLAANQQGWGAYVAIATRNRDLGRWHRGGKGDLAQLPALFIDLDEPGDPRRRLESFGLPPSYVVHSGRGHHVYWSLRQPTTNWWLAERAIAGLVSYFGADPHASLAQSLRLVGSDNTKPGRDGAPCRLVAAYPDRQYDLADFLPFMAPACAFRQRSPGPLVATGPAWSREPVEPVRQAVVERLVREYGGYWKANGWVAALCPWGHHRDRPGQHFGFLPDRQVALCFGRHGKRSLGELCQLLGVG